MTDDWLDFYLDNILKASGSALKHYSMQKTKDDMRQALRQAIAGLESQEFVCEWCDGTGMVDSGGTQPWGEAINIPCRCQHTHPPQRTWQGLTDYEIGVCSTEAAMNRSEMVGGAVTFARAIEAKLKEKNT